jgi:hypothetical protein
MRHILRLLWRGNSEGLIQAKQADKQAGEDLDEARKNATRANHLLTRNHLSERFINDLRHGGHA